MQNEGSCFRMDEIFKNMNTTNKLPAFMAEGSKGPHVTPLHSFLAGMGKGILQGLVFDAEYGQKTTELVKEFQNEQGLTEDGCFGPETRDFAKNESGFDFKTACQTIPGKTIFCDLEHGEEEIEYENII